MLVEVRVGNFQSFVTAQLIRFEPTVTFLVGRNDVGKSALLRALLVFSAQQAPGRSGFSLRLVETLPSKSVLVAIPIANEQDLVNGPTIEGIRSLLSATEFVKVERDYVTGIAPDQPVTAGDMHLMRMSISGIEEATWSRGPDNAFRWAGDPTLGDKEPLSKAGGYVEAALRTPFVPRYLAPKRAAATGDAGKTSLMYADTLAADGSNLTNVWAMATLNRREVVEEVEAFMRGAFPSVARIDAFSSATSVGSASTWTELHVIYRDGRRVPLKQCGTGIEQMLILATGVVTAEHSEVFLIDEPHGYLHSDAERKLMEFIDQHPRHQYVIATHSPTLLRAKPINHGRLFRFEEGETRVSNVGGREAILSALDLTPIDLWLDRGIVWVEGPTEEAVLGVVKGSVDDLRGAAFAIKALPDASRFASSGARTAASAFEALHKVSDAVTPLPVISSFVLDPDERKEAAMDEIKRLAEGRTFFLPFREIENAFLDADLIHAALTERAAQLAQPAPGLNAVKIALKRILNQPDDQRLYRERPAEGKPSRQHVVGSEVLGRLYWDFITAAYDKVSDGKRLAELATRDHGPLLQPLIDVLRAATSSALP